LYVLACAFSQARLARSASSRFILPNRHVPMLPILLSLDHLEDALAVLIMLRALLSLDHLEDALALLMGCRDPLHVATGPSESSAHGLQLSRVRLDRWRNAFSPGRSEAAAHPLAAPSIPRLGRPVIPWIENVAHSATSSMLSLRSARNRRSKHLRSRLLGVGFFSAVTLAPRFARDLP
jgi:hypothetical protein